MFLTAVFFLSAIPAQVPESPKIAVSFHVERASKPDVYEAKSVFPRFGSDSAVAKLATSDAAKELSATRANFMGSVGEVVRIPLEHEAGAIVSIARRDFVSLYLFVYEFTGGAHPNRLYTGMTWGVVDGKARRLKFADFLKPGEDAVAVASRVVVPKLVAAGASDFEDGERTALDAEMTEHFVVTPAGVTWIFSPYEAGPYVDGEFFIKVPWSELRASLRG